MVKIKRKLNEKQTLNKVLIGQESDNLLTLIGVGSEVHIEKMSDKTVTLKKCQF